MADLLINCMAEPPKTKGNVGDDIRFMVQSLDASEESTINFLVKLWAFYLKNGYLTDRQLEVFKSIYSDFFKSFKTQFPFKRKKDIRVKTANGETIQ